MNAIMKELMKFPELVAIMRTASEAEKETYRIGTMKRLTPDTKLPEPPSRNKEEDDREATDTDSK